MIDNIPSRSTGLWTHATAPIRRDSSSAVGLALTTMIGIPASLGSADRKRRNDSPLSCGIMRSSRMTAGGELRTASSASNALLAVVTEIW